MSEFQVRFNKPPNMNQIKFSLVVRSSNFRIRFEKIGNWPSRIPFFQAKELFSKVLILNHYERFKNGIEDKKENLCSGFSDRVSHKIYFMG